MPIAPPWGRRLPSFSVRVKPGVLLVGIAGAVLTAFSCSSNDATTDPSPSPSPVATVVVTPGTVGLHVGEAVQLTATLLDAAGHTLADRNISWSTSDASKASVASGGLVRGESIGEATVTASCEGESGYATVSVAAPSVVGAKIVFNTDRDGNFEIYVMDPDGTNPINLTNHPGSDIHPVWSPDGSRIAFASTRGGGGKHEIYSMNADGTDVTRLTTFSGEDLFPSWAAHRIAFERWLPTLEQGSLEIFIMNEDGTDPTNLTNNVDFARGPSLSPDGSKIVFQSDRDYEIDFTEIWPEIWVMNADGSRLVNLSNTDTAGDGFPEWSPDGLRIAFESERDGNYDVFIMNANGSSPVNITNSAGYDGSPSWSPDGTSIVFQSNRGGKPEIYTIGIDGTGLTRLTDNSATDAWPDWRP